VEQAQTRYAILAVVKKNRSESGYQVSPSTGSVGNRLSFPSSGIAAGSVHL
jgi:hypothetical protein